MKRLLIITFSLLMLMSTFSSDTQSFPPGRNINATRASQSGISSECSCKGVYLLKQINLPFSICAGSNQIQISVTAKGTEPIIYQWFEDSIALADVGIYSGTNTAVLNISNPPFSLHGKKYYCQLNNCANKIISSQSFKMNITSLLTDIDKDGFTGYNDYVLLTNKFNMICSGCYEDLTHDGVIDTRDFLILLGDYNKHCSL